jgi:hypothetical protein
MMKRSSGLPTKRGQPTKRGLPSERSGLDHGSSPMKGKHDAWLRRFGVVRHLYQID